MPLPRACCLLFLPAVAALVAGCGTGNSQAPANISGSVSYNGKPVTGGTVQFIASDGQAFSGNIAADGTYAIADVAVGEMVIVVETESINPKNDENKPTGKDAQRYMNQSQQQPPGGRPAGGTNTSADAPKYMKIPEKYGNSKTSPLTLTVKAGRQVHSVELN